MVAGPYFLIDLQLNFKCLPVAFGLAVIASIEPKYSIQSFAEVIKLEAFVGPIDLGFFRNICRLGIGRLWPQFNLKVPIGFLWRRFRCFFRTV